MGWPSPGPWPIVGDICNLGTDGQIGTQAADLPAAAQLTGLSEAAAVVGAFLRPLCSLWLAFQRQSWGQLLQPLASVAAYRLHDFDL